MSVFFALDVETANPDQSSICQIGIAKFVDNVIVDTWSFLINPKSDFDGFNISIHGITESDVADAPTFSEIYHQLDELLANQIVLHHGPFDLIAFTRSFERFSLQAIDCNWLDNTKVVRRTWEEFYQSGYNLKNLAQAFDLELNHHDALSDCIAAGKVFVNALKETNTLPEFWLERTKTGIITSGGNQNFAQDGNAESPFSGENIVFTGALSIPRRTAAPRAASIGFSVQNNVTKKTTYLCVGLLDFTKLAGNDKTNKQIKAENLIQGGQHITIISEQDFLKLLEEFETR